MNSIPCGYSTHQSRPYNDEHLLDEPDLPQSNYETGPEHTSQLDNFFYTNYQGSCNNVLSMNCHFGAEVADEAVSFDNLVNFAHPNVTNPTGVFFSNFRPETFDCQDLEATKLITDSTLTQLFEIDNSATSMQTQEDTFAMPNVISSCDFENSYSSAFGRSNLSSDEQLQPSYQQSRIVQPNPNSFLRLEANIEPPELLDSCEDMTASGLCPALFEDHKEHFTNPTNTRKAGESAKEGFQDANNPLTLNVQNNEPNPAVPSVPERQDWEALRPIIISLFSKHTHKEIKGILREKHGYSTSDKSLKDHLRKWDKHKNLKQKEWTHISRLITTREAVGKSSNVRVRGWPIKKEKINLYRKRNDDKFRLDISLPKSPAPSSILVFTPPASPPPELRALRATDQMVRTLNNYIHGSFEAQTWVSLGELNRLRYRRSRTSRQTLPNLLKAIFNLSTESAETTNTLSAQISEYIDDMLACEHSLLIFDILCSAQRYGRTRIHDFFKRTLQEIHAKSEQKFGLGHPITQICSLLTSLFEGADTSLGQYMVDIGIKAMLDGFEHVLGPLHLHALDARIDYVLAVFENDLEGSILNLRKLVQQCDENDQGRTDRRPLTTRLLLARVILHKMGAPPCEAETIVQEVTKRTEWAKLPKIWSIFYRSSALCCRGIYSIRLGRLKEGQEHINEAIKIRSKLFGENEPSVMQQKSILKNLVKCNSADEAVTEIAQLLDSAL